MTLIQTYFTQDRVIQMSDRRLTRADGTLFDDNHTKLVFWHGCFTVGFTGLAFIDRRQTKATAEWIAEILCDYTCFEYGLEGLCYETQECMRRLPNSWDKRLSIVIAGFDFRRDPLVGHITNYPPGHPTNLNNVCWTKFVRSAGKVDGYAPVGAGMFPAHHLVFDRYMRKLLRQPDGLNQAIRLMVKMQRQVAAANKTVGASALCATIPRDRSVLGPDILMGSLETPRVHETGCRFVYFGEDGFEYRMFGPHTASHGMAMGGMFAESRGPNRTTQWYSTKILKMPNPGTTPNDDSGAGG